MKGITQPLAWEGDRGSYHHRTMSGRACILLMHDKQNDIPQIAQAPGRSKSTISRELHGNTRRHGYRAHEAQNLDTRRRRTGKPHLKVMRPEHRKHLIGGREQYRSPEQMIGHHGRSLCPATIYRVLKNGLFPTVLREQLRQEGNSCKAEGEERRGTVPDCLSQGERPTAAAARSRGGDWEGDTVAGEWRTGCFRTLVDRKTRVLVEKKLDDHRTETLKDSICSSLKGVPCHTWTGDNGKEFAAHNAITAESRAPASSAHSHRPWKRRTNENTNRLSRQFFPKDMSFLTVTQEHLDHAIHLLNNRPRKCLNWETPYKALAEELLHLV